MSYRIISSAMNWIYGETSLPNLYGQILFLDEENRFVKSKTARIS